MLIRSPEIMHAIASASRIGQYDGEGMWIAAMSWGVAARGRGAGLPPWPSPFFCSQNSSRSCTIGSIAKLYTGGGEGIDHSSVRPSQGSGPAGVPERMVLMTLTMNNTNESAMISDPMVETRFQKFQPRSGAYV